MMINDSQHKRKKERRCLVCRNMFAPANYWQKYCGKKCRLLGWAKKELATIG